jgi:hypothetical protein
MSNAAEAIVDALEKPLARLGFGLAGPASSLTASGAAFLKLRPSSANIQLTLDPSPEGARVRLFVLSSFGDWVQQDLARWGIPAVLRYRHPGELRHRARAIASVLRAALRQAEPADPGG